MIKLYLGTECAICDGMCHFAFDCPYCGATDQEHYQGGGPFETRCTSCGSTIRVGLDSLCDFDAREKTHAPDLYYWSKPSNG